jgi:hypothetical protein
MHRFLGTHEEIEANGVDAWGAYKESYTRSRKRQTMKGASDIGN